MKKSKRRARGYTLIDDGQGHTFKIKSTNFDEVGRPRDPMLLVKLGKMREGRRAAAKRDRER